MTQRALVAIHGHFASAVWWFDLLADPPHGWRVLAPNLPGFGGTYHHGDVSIAAYAEWLAGWLNERRVTRPVLLGQGLGGAVALELAAQEPSGVAGLILAASVPPTGWATPERPWNRNLDGLFPSGRPGNFAQFTEDAARMAPGHDTGNARALTQWSVNPAALRGLPALVMGGALDPWVPPEMVRAAAQAVDTSAVIVDGVGYGFPQEQPAVFRAHVTAFLNALPPSE